jgi:hypothetical protein
MSCRTSFYATATLLALGLGGCQKPTTGPDPAAPGSPAPAGPYFDLRGLLDAQARQLDARHAAVEKEVRLRQEAPETTRVPAVKWTDELQLFYQADINKAALRGAYALDSATVPGLGLRRTYTLRPGFPRAAVLQLAVTGPASQPARIEARLRQDNALFYGAKSLTMSFDHGQLRTYGVSGVQKLVLFDSLRYRTTARVL